MKISYSARTKHLESILYKEEDEVQIANWINKINSRNPYFNREKPKKEVSKRRKNDIVDVATRVKHQVLYVRVTSILNSRSE